MGFFSITNTGGSSLEIFRGEFDGPDGDPLFHEVNYREYGYIVPPAGEYQLRVTGFGKPKKRPIDAYYQRPGGPTEQIITELELEIVSSRGSGRRFLWSFLNWSLHPDSKIGAVYSAAVLGGKKTDKSGTYAMDNLIGREFMGYVQPSDTVDDDGRPKYAIVQYKTVRPVGVSKDYDPFDAD